MITAVFARADHPHGWGFVDHEGQGRAHGYVVLLVSCDTHVDVTNVERRLRHAFAGTDEKPLQYPWYGGMFDLVAMVETPSPPGYFAAVMDRAGRAMTWRSYGDNRAAAWYTANEVLAAGVPRAAVS